MRHHIDYVNIIIKNIVANVYYLVFLEYVRESHVY